MATLSLAPFIQKVDPLTNKNWHRWQNQMLMVFRMRSACFAKLKAKFEASNFTRRVELWKAFSGAVHDPSKPIEVYIQSIINAKNQMVAIGQAVTEVQVKDTIIMNLHPSYDTIKVSLLTQPTEPNLATIRSILGNSSPIIDSPAIKLEPMDTALVAGTAENAFVAGRGKQGQREAGLPKEDEKGRRWCDPNNENHCFRCGHPGHVAFRCVAEMPPEIKTWVLTGPNGQERSMYVSQFRHHNSRSHHFQNHHQSESRSRSHSPNWCSHTPFGFVNRVASSDNAEQDFEYWRGGERPHLL